MIENLVRWVRQNGVIINSLEGPNWIGFIDFTTWTTWRIKVSHLSSLTDPLSQTLLQLDGRLDIARKLSRGIPIGV